MANYASSIIYLFHHFIMMIIERFINIRVIGFYMAEETKPLEILAVDDKQPITELLSKSLARQGHMVTTASSGNEGIEKYIEASSKGTPYKLVFTDLDMPNGTGVDVTREVKLRSPNTPVYVISGYMGNEQHARLQKELQELKPDGILEKPFDLNLINGIAERVASGQDHKQFVADYLVEEAAERAKIQQQFTQS